MSKKPQVFFLLVSKLTEAFTHKLEIILEKEETEEENEIESEIEQAQDKFLHEMVNLYQTIRDENIKLQAKGNADEMRIEKLKEEAKASKDFTATEKMQIRQLINPNSNITQINSIRKEKDPIIHLMIEDEEETEIDWDAHLGNYEFLDETLDGVLLPPNIKKERDNYEDGNEGLFEDFQQGFYCH